MQPTPSTDGIADEQLLVSARRDLLRWYRRHRRDLPWRRTRDAYAIWVSEIMLQQTRVDVVVPFYEAFLQRFPDIDSLAEAPTDDVLRHWAGLGYYSRARNLQRAARQIVDRHAGLFPQRRDEVLALAGIGPYTAGAILSIAFGQRQPIVDGNVMRVMARLFELQERIETPAAQRRFWEWAAWWADCDDPGDANQAIMELGATVCDRSSPRCGDCPISNSCRAAQTGQQQTLPMRSPRRAAVDVDLVAFLVRRRGRLLLARRHTGELLQQFWEIPTHVRLDTAPSGDAQPDLQASQRRFEAHTGLRVDSWRSLGETRHGILHHRIRVRILEAVAVDMGGGRTEQRPTDRPAADPLPASQRAAERLQNLSEGMSLRWATASQARRLALTTLTHKVLRTAARVDSTWQNHAGHRPAQQTAGGRGHEPA